MVINTRPCVGFLVEKQWLLILGGKGMDRRFDMASAHYYQKQVADICDEGRVGLKKGIDSIEE